MKWVSVLDKPPPMDGTPIVAFDPSKPKNRRINILFYENYRGSWGWRELHLTGYARWTPTYYITLPKKEPGEMNDRLPLFEKQEKFIPKNPFWRKAWGYPPLEVEKPTIVLMKKDRKERKSKWRKLKRIEKVA